MEKTLRENQNDPNNLVRKKRARATTEQLSVLEGVFVINISPNGKIRKQLAEQLNMTERSVQIWFQNKRAKVKNLQKKARTQHIPVNFYGSYEQASLLPFKTPMPSHRYTSDFAQGPVTYPILTQNTSINRLPSTFPDRNDIPGTYQRAFNFNVQHDRAILGKHLENNFYLPTSLSPPPDERLRHKEDGISTNQRWPQQHRSNSFLESRQDNELNDLSLKKDTHRPLEACAYSSFNKKDKSPSLKPQSLLHSTGASSGHPLTNNVYASGPSGVSHYLPVASITIGAWHRFKLHSSDLVCAYEPSNTFVWYIINSNVHFKIEIPISSVTKIEVIEALPLMRRHANQTVFYEKQLELAFYLCQIPLFYMQSTTAQQGWVQCTDFTESKQALKHFQHILKGESEAIKQGILQMVRSHPQIEKLVVFQTHGSAVIESLSSLPYPSPNSRYSLSPSHAFKTAPDGDFLVT